MASRTIRTYEHTRNLSEVHEQHFPQSALSFTLTISLFIPKTFLSTENTSRKSYGDYVHTVSMLEHRNVSSTKTPWNTSDLSYHHMAQDKVQCIVDWPEPHKVKDVQSFLGFCNFYHCFIHRYTEIAIPLTQLTCKNAPWNFSEVCRTAFNCLKEEFT